MRLDHDGAESLRGELALLHKNEGFSQRRLRQTPIVDEVLRYGNDDTYERLKSRFVSAIYSLDDEREQTLLLDVFALSPETDGIPNLSQRRAVHGAKLGRSIDTVRSRENAALTHLHSRLVTGMYPQSPLVLHVPEMHGGIVYEHTSTLIVVENRKWRETLEYYRFVNLHDELDYVTVTRSYDGIVYPRAGGSFKVNTRPVPGAGYNDHFWHLNGARTETSPMCHGETYDLRFRITPVADNQVLPSPLSLASRAFHHRSLLASIQVGFVNERPTSLWTFEQVSPYARPDKANDDNRVKIDERGRATLRLRDVHGGLFSGIAWKW